MNKLKKLKINFARAHSPLGPLMLGTTDQGVCAVFFSDDKQEIIAGRFPRAVFDHTHTRTHHYLQQLIEHIESPHQPLSLPLDLHGTDFQKNVWRKLCTTKIGTTISYSHLAHLIGHPTATRAVANACGANPVAILVPCHRVIAKDGSIGGFSYDIALKRALLDRECRSIG
jgi:AraC family transcriptional regulator of adaptative response/methylated-DNA-[protein]-cysteine methyltransferase